MATKILDIFFGGTCNDSEWRDKLISLLPANCTYFNPVIDSGWTEECQKRELIERTKADIVLYTITPKMTGVYSIAEVVDDSNKQPDSTVLCLLKTDPNGKDKTDTFDEGQWKSLEKVADMIKKNGAHVFYNLEDLVKYFKSVIRKRDDLDTIDDAVIESMTSILGYKL